MELETEPHRYFTDDQKETRDRPHFGRKLTVKSNLGVIFSILLTFLFFSVTSPCSAGDSSDCKEPDIAFPVKFSNQDKPNTKGFLMKVIRNLVVSGNQYIEDSLPDFQVSRISDILAKEYGCETGTTLSSQETKEFITILKHIYVDVLRKGDVMPLTADEDTSLLNRLRDRGRDTSNCCTAITELSKMVTTTAREAVREKIDYETALQQRDARIAQCGKVTLAAEQKTKTEIEMKRRQEELERQRAEEQKVMADAERKRQSEELERTRKEAQKEQKRKADAEALELHKRTMALEKEREDQLKAETDALKRETDKLEQERREISTKVEAQRQLELEKDRQKVLQDKIDADKERQVISERQRQQEEVRARQRQIENQSAAEKERQSKVREELEKTRRVRDIKSGKTVEKPSEEKADIKNSSKELKTNNELTKAEADELAILAKKMYDSVSGEKETKKLKRFLNGEADVNDRDETGSTILMDACHALVFTEKAPEIVAFLLAKGADVNVRNNNGWTPLMFASLYQRREAVKLLLAHGADVNARDKEGKSALMKVCMLPKKDEEVEMVKLFLDRGADVNAKDKGGWTALMFASRSGHCNITRLFLDKGADVNARNNDGLTPLIYASMLDHLELAKLLLAKGADANANVKGVVYPMTYAKPEMAKLLKEYGAVDKRR